MDRLSEIRARCEVATPGPWEWDLRVGSKYVDLHSRKWPMNIVMNFVRWGMSGAAPRFGVDGLMERCDALAKSYPGKEHHSGFDDYIDHPDAAFIAHSRDDIPYLLARLEKAEAENRWIPVSERLPERGERVIAYSPAMGGTEAEIQISKGFMLHSKRTDITHWRPLPEPPKGE